ncbi:MAG: N-acyl-D-amino-acid deacylase family protein [Planctomycetota bacterium]
MHRRTFLKRGAAGLVTAILAQVEVETEFDVVIGGGRVLDGTGAPSFRADVGIRGDKIVALANGIARSRARKWVDASGLAIAPGFIDIHTHSDSSIEQNPCAESRVLQGCTTEITGNCGGSAAPGAEATDGVAAYFGRLRASGLSVNQALLIGHGTLRELAGAHSNRRVTSDEQLRMEQLLDVALDDGAIGLSTGLEYAPGRFADSAEIEALARVVARRGGLYASHLRNEVLELLAAVTEALDVGRRTGVRVQVSHLKTAGKPSWPLQDPALKLIEDARRAGTDVLADAYPYTAYHTSLSIYFPADVLEDGTAAMLRRLGDATVRARLLKELPGAIANDPGGFDRMVLSSIGGNEHQAFVGRDLAAISKELNVEPGEALLRLVESGGGRASYIGHAMSEENVARVLAHPLVMIASDGSSLAMMQADDAGTSRPHPRSFGTFARVLGRYCRTERLFSLETAIRKMTSMPADQAGFADRGRVARGKKADLVVFNADTIADTATFEAPRGAPVGISQVFVNGVAVVDNGRHTGARPGRVLTP